MDVEFEDKLCDYASISVYAIVISSFFFFFGEHIVISSLY